MSAVRRGGMIGLLLGGMSGVRRVAMTVVGLRLGGMSGLGIRVGSGLGLLGMRGRPGSGVASGLGRGVMTGLGLCLGGMSGPGTRGLLRAGMSGLGIRGLLLGRTTVGRVGMIGLGRGVKSVAAGGTSASAVGVGPGGRTRRGLVRARTTRSFRLGSPVRNSTVG